MNLLRRAIERFRVIWSPRLRAQHGVTTVEYGIMIAVFGVGMIAAAGFLLTATKSNYNTAESRVADPKTACIGDEIVDSSTGQCIANPMKVISVTPAKGASAGSTAVTITGTSFATNATVTFDGVPATSVVVGTGGGTGIATSITAITPAGTAGPADVKVTNPSPSTLSATGFGIFTYLGPAPTITAVTPTSGPAIGGNSITITGTNFAAGASVAIGGNLASTVSFVDTTSLTAFAPAGTVGAKAVVVTNADGQSTTGTVNYTYIAGPTITGVSPAAGPLAGNRTVTITGSGFVDGANVSVGGTSAVSVTFNSATQLTVVFPGGTAGAKGVLVTNPDTQYFLLTNGYTYMAAPTATTSAADTIGKTTASLNGTVNASGGSTAVTFKYCTNLAMTTACQTGTASPSPVAGVADQSVSLDVTGLTKNTTYYFQVLATSGGGSVTGSVLNFKTLNPSAPTVTTSAADTIGKTTASLNGSVNPNFAVTTVSFCWGTSSTLNGCTTTAAVESPLALGSTALPVSLDLTGLTKNTTYYFRVTATNSEGTKTGSILNFKTRNPSAPTVTTTTPATSIAGTSANVAGTVDANDAVATVTVLYCTSNDTTGGMLTTGCAAAVAATPGTATGSSATNVAASLSGLSKNTTYYFQVVAVNSEGTTYGTVRNFKTLAAYSGTTPSANYPTSATYYTNNDNSSRTMSSIVTTVPNITFTSASPLPSNVTFTSGSTGTFAFGSWNNADSVIVVSWSVPATSTSEGASGTFNFRVT